MSRKRVVLVCMVDSIHVARWIAQFDESEVEFTLFPSTPNRRVHAMIKDMMAMNGNIKIVPFGGKLSIPLWGMDLIFSDYVRGLLLRGILKREPPDFVHALELQHGGYITSRALEDTSLKTPFIATNYGSDIYWFQQFPKHLAKIKKLLARADRYSAECNRDVELAKKYGFTGEVMPVFPNAGGFTEEQLNRPLIPTADRRVIAIKGYEGWVGRASAAVEALYLLAKELADFKVVFYSCNTKTARLVKKLKRKTGLNIEWHAKGELSHKQMLDLFASARISVGLSLSDGISTSFLESIVNKSFAIQSSTACAAEWLTDPRFGTIVDGLEPKSLAMSIKAGLQSSAAKVPDRIIAAQRANLEKLEWNRVLTLSLKFYHLNSRSRASQVRGGFTRRVASE